MAQATVPYDFNPGISSRLYFIRHGLYEGIKKNAKELSGRLMDFGCGEKPYRSLFSHVSEYIGVDYKGEGHDHVNEEIDVFYDGKTLPFSNESFDSVLSTEVFEHLFNLEESLKELHRVLKPAGRVLFTCPFVWFLHEEPVDYARYTPYALKALLENNGFKVLSMEKSGSSIEAINQIRVAAGLNRFLNNRVTRFLYIGKAFNRLFILYMNLSTILKTKIRMFENSPDFYLNNIVLAEKI